MKELEELGEGSLDLELEACNLDAEVCALDTVLRAFSGAPISGIVKERCIAAWLLGGATEAAGAYSMALSSAALDGAVEAA